MTDANNIEAQVMIELKSISKRDMMDEKTILLRQKLDFVNKLAKQDRAKAYETYLKQHPEIDYKGGTFVFASSTDKGRFSYSIRKLPTYKLLSQIKKELKTDQPET